MQGTAHFKSSLNPNGGVTSPKATECEPSKFSVSRKGADMQYCTHRESLLTGGLRSEYWKKKYLSYGERESHW